MVDIEAVLKDLIERFNKKALEDDKLRKELKDVTRKIEINISDQGSFNMLLKDVKLIDFSKGEADSPDIKVITDSETFDGLLSRKIGPMKALATKRLKIKASLEDMLRFRKLIF
jgi:putative sterol carrier protein